MSRLTARLSNPNADVWRIHDEAVRRLADGDDVILLSVGDPDFPTPDYILEHTVGQMRRGRTHYSPAAGEPVLRRTIAELESRVEGYDFTPEQFVIYPGATAALFGLFSCILDPGDEVVIPEPMYIGYRGIFDAIGAEVVSVPLEGDGFELNPDAVLAAVGKNCKAVLVNTPGNPCGNLIPPETLAALAAALKARDVWLVCDEVYSLITFDQPHVSLLRCTHDLSNIVVVDGLSKSHAMSGWRLGWLVAPPAMVEKLTRFAGATFFGCCQFIQDGAAYALQHDPTDVEVMRREYQRRRDFACERLDRIGNLGYSKPEGGMFIMLNASRVANDGDDFARRLLDEAGISTIPGRGFGPTAASYVRMSLTQPVPVLEAALERMARVASR